MEGKAVVGHACRSCRCEGSGRDGLVWEASVGTWARQRRGER